MNEAQGTQRHPHWNDVAERTGTILDVRAEMEARRTKTSRTISEIARFLARPSFFIGLALVNIGWIVVNLPIMPWEPWDPYPFVFLATVTSVEAPLLSLLILMHQERDKTVDELREETLLQVSLHNERELSVGLRLLDEIRRGLDIDTSQQEELMDLLQETLDPKRLMENLRWELKQMGKTD